MHQHILTIDESENTTISYHKSDVSSFAAVRISWKKLTDAYEKNPESIFDYDTGDTVTLIKNDNTEIPLCCYKKEDQISFIKLIPDFIDKNISMNDCEILIAVGSGIYIERLPWTRYLDLTPDILYKSQDVSDSEPDGYKTCMRYIKSTNSDLYTAVNKCMKIKKIVDYIDYQGFLPSILQMQFIIDKASIINYIFNCLGDIDNIGKFISSNFINCWTSTEVPEDDQYKSGLFAYTSNIFISSQIAYKGMANYVFPIFKRMN